MTKEEKIEQFIEENNLKRIEITTGNNGYPQNLRKAIIGFDNYKQLEEFTSLKEDKEWNECQIFRKRDGWQLYENRGYTFESFTINDYINKVNDCYEVNITTEIEYLTDGIKDNIDDLEIIKDYNNRLESLLTIYEELEDNQTIIWDREEYDIWDDEFMSFSEDVWSYNLGIYL